MIIFNLWTVSNWCNSSNSWLEIFVFQYFIAVFRRSWTDAFLQYRELCSVRPALVCVHPVISKNPVWNSLNDFFEERWRWLFTVNIMSCHSKVQQIALGQEVSFWLKWYLNEKNLRIYWPESRRLLSALQDPCFSAQGNIWVRSGRGFTRAQVKSRERQLAQSHVAQNQSKVAWNF